MRLRHHRAHQIRLPGHELVGEVGLEAAPGEVVGRRRVALRTPQFGKVRQPVGPVREPPRPIEGVDVDVEATKVLHEPQKHGLVVQQLVARFVVHLPADHGRVVRPAADDGPNEAFGQMAEGRMRDIDVLSAAVGDRLPGGVVRGRLGIPVTQPRRDRIRRSPHDHADPSGMGAVEHGCDPLQVEHAFLRFPRRPHRLPDTDHREAGGRHQVQVLLGPLVRLVLGVVSGADKQVVQEHGHIPRGLCGT